jgi:predicted DNA-binding transcriptional regulator YafY
MQSQKPNPKWTREERARVLVEMYRDLTVREFANAFDVSAMQVHADINRLRSAGIKLGE